MEETRKEVDWNMLIANPNAEENAHWKTKLTQVSLIEYYLVCVKLIENITRAIEYVFTAHIIKDWRTCDSLQIAAIMVDGKSYKQVQKRDIDSASNDNAGDEIFSLFLEILCSTIISIIQMKSCTSMNAVHE